MFECAGILVECGAVCAPGEIDAPACIKCMGNFYDTCKDCFSTLAAIEKQAGKLREVHSLHVAIPNKCVITTTDSCSATKIGPSFPDSHTPNFPTHAASQ